MWPEPSTKASQRNNYLHSMTPHCYISLRKCSTASGDLRAALVPISRLFVGVACAQDFLLAKRRPNKLQTNWHPLRVEAARQAQSADTTEAGRDCKHIFKIHLQRIVDLFPNREGSTRRRWCGDDIYLRERFVEVALDEG